MKATIKLISIYRTNSVTIELSSYDSNNDHYYRLLKVDNLTTLERNFKSKQEAVMEFQNMVRRELYIV